MYNLSSSKLVSGVMLDIIVSLLYHLIFMNSILLLLLFYNFFFWLLLCLAVQPKSHKGNAIFDIKHAC